MQKVLNKQYKSNNQTQETYKNFNFKRILFTTKYSEGSDSGVYCTNNTYCIRVRSLGDDCAWKKRVAIIKFEVLSLILQQIEMFREPGQ